MANGMLPDGFKLRPESMLCFDIYATHHAIGQTYQPLLSELGLTYPQYLVMIVLWERDGQSVGDVAARLDLASSTLTPLIKRLESQGLLERKRDTCDERKVRVTLTRTGRALKQKASHVPACVAKSLGLTLEELVQLQTTLGKIRTKLKLVSEAEVA